MRLLLRRIYIPAAAVPSSDYLLLTFCEWGIYRHFNKTVTMSQNKTTSKPPQVGQGKQEHSCDHLLTVKHSPEPSMLDYKRNNYVRVQDETDLTMWHARFIDRADSAEHAVKTIHCETERRSKVRFRGDRTRVHTQAACVTDMYKTRFVSDYAPQHRWDIMAADVHPLMGR